MKTRPSSLLSVLILAVSPAVLANCGDDDDGGKAAGSVATSSSAPSTASTAAPTTATSVAAAPGPSTPLSTEGLGSIKLGMTFEEARKAAGRQYPYEGPENGGSCGTLELGVKGVETYLIGPGETGPLHIASIASSEPSLRTDNGVGVGSTAAQVRAAYPAAAEGNSLGSWGLVVKGTLGVLSFRMDSEASEPVPASAKVIYLSANRSDVADGEELCA